MPSAQPHSITSSRTSRNTMQTSIVRYRKVYDQYTVHQLQLPEANAEASCTELATLSDGYTYVAVPSSLALPQQPIEILVEDVVLTPELRQALKAASTHCELIANRVEQKIREKYSLNDEQYFSRIASGAALNLYTFEPGEQSALIAFGDYVESCRQWGRQERAKLGL